MLSGVANPVLTADQLDTPCSYEGMAAAGSGLGAAGSWCSTTPPSMVEVARELSRFLYVESCGQCPACKLGTGAITDLLDALAAGEAVPDDLDVIAFRLQTVTDGNRCYLPVQERLVVSSILQAFPRRGGRGARRAGPAPSAASACPSWSTWPAARATYDDDQAPQAARLDLRGRLSEPPCDADSRRTMSE